MIGGKRSQRRRDKLRMKARARRLYGDGADGALGGHTRPEIFADYLAKCSCALCGNRRHLEGLTMQERRALA